MLKDNRNVSILVLMDFRLKEALPLAVSCVPCGFNPCSNGLSAQSASANSIKVLFFMFQSLF